MEKKQKVLVLSLFLFICLSFFSCGKKGSSSPVQTSNQNSTCEGFDCDTGINAATPTITNPYYWIANVIYGPYIKDNDTKENISNAILTFKIDGNAIASCEGGNCTIWEGDGYPTNDLRSWIKTIATSSGTNKTFKIEFEATHPSYYTGRTSFSITRTSSSSIPDYSTWDSVYRWGEENSIYGVDLPTIYLLKK